MELGGGVGRLAAGVLRKERAGSRGDRVWNVRGPKTVVSIAGTRDGFSENGFCGKKWKEMVSSRWCLFSVFVARRGAFS